MSGLFVEAHQGCLIVVDNSDVHTYTRASLRDSERKPLRVRF